MKNLWRIEQQYQLISPTAEQIKPVCPHLTDIQLKELLNVGTETYLALPPVLVKGAFRIAKYVPAPEGSRSLPYFRILPECGRLSQIGRGNNYQYLDQATNYAWRQWGPKLVRENWVASQTVYLLHANSDRQLPQDDDRRSHASAKTKHIIWVGLKHRPGRPYSDMEDSLEGWDELIACCTTNRVEGLEIEGNLGSIRAFNCIICGGVLNSKGCYSQDCRNRTSESSVTIAFGYWRSPLPPKLMKAAKIIT